MDGSEELRQREVTILDSVNEGVFTVDLDWRITAFNKAAERITGVSRELAIGSPCCDVFRANICETKLRPAADDGQRSTRRQRHGPYRQPARSASADPDLHGASAG